MGKHMGSEKLGSFYTGKKARRRREWRGVRDTMYDYAQWLRIWGVLLRFAAKPNNVRAFFRYRWMLNYLVVPDFFDRHTEGMRGAQLRITHTALSIVVIDMCKSMTRMFKADPNIGNDEKLRKRMVLFDENISEISCHAMGVHLANPDVHAIIDIGGQDVKGIAIDTDGTVLNFAMNDKCAAGTGRFFESMANAFELSLEEFSKLSLKAKNVIPITSQCTVFAESEVVSLVGEGKPMEEIAAGIQLSVAKRCFVMAKKAGAVDQITLTGGCAKNEGLKQAIEKVLKIRVVDLPIDPQLMGALGAAEFARRKAR